MYVQAGNFKIDVALLVEQGDRAYAGLLLESDGEPVDLPTLLWMKQRGLAP
jgi:hypothetical protein